MAVLVGKQAPFFHDADKRFAAVLGDGQMVEDYNFQKASAGKYAVVFFTRLILLLYARLN